MSLSWRRYKLHSSFQFHPSETEQVIQLTFRKRTHESLFRYLTHRVCYGGLLNMPHRSSRRNTKTIVPGIAFRRMSTSIDERLSVGALNAFRQLICSRAVSYNILRPLALFPDTTCGTFLEADKFCCSTFFRSPNLSLRISTACVEHDSLVGNPAKDAAAGPVALYSASSLPSGMCSSTAESILESSRLL
uniref:Uncharacterized protein n=1 Tax=Rhipicephalus zambeziensis TaxID=60191 RepID=A0A224YCH4_9ACAR